METTNRPGSGNTAELRQRLEEAEETIRALRAGEVDALFVQGASPPVHTIEAVDRPYRLLVDHVPRGAASLTVDGTILHANRPFLGLIDQPLEAMVGRFVQDFVTAPSRERLESLIREAVRSEVHGHVDLVRADGLVPIHVSLTTIEEGALGRCLILTDRTEQWLYAELQRAEDGLRHADRMKDEFLAILAHELRNPLAPIQNAVRILKLKQASDPDLEWVQGILERQVGVMARLVDDLLDVSRLSRNQLQLGRTRTGIATVIDAAIETSLPLIHERRHELVVDVPSEPLPVYADRVRLAQVFANLLNNAARYTEHGGHIRLEVEREGNEIVVRVVDDGIGIPAEMQAHIFDLFSQAEPARTLSVGGLGVGLSLAQRLIAMHDGTIAVHSPGAGKGSEFVVRLPMAPEPVVDPPSEGKRSAHAQRRCRVLVADDNRDSTDALATLLRMNGHEVSTAYDGLQAIDLARERKPDAVLLDIVMSPIDGRDACRRIREQPWGKRMLMIALSGGGQDEDRRLNHEAGFDHHLVKPAEFEKLDEILRTITVAAPGG